MQAFLLCDDAVFGRSIRQILVREGVDCPTSAMIGYAQAARRLSAEPPELIIAVLPDDPLRSLEALDVLPTVPHPERDPGHRRRSGRRHQAGDPRPEGRRRRLCGHERDGARAGRGPRRLAAAEVAGRPEGRLIAVLGPSGGAGSSTIAASLAALLAKEHKSVALIDLKLETGRPGRPARPEADLLAGRPEQERRPARPGLLPAGARQARLRGPACSPRPGSWPTSSSSRPRGSASRSAWPGRSSRSSWSTWTTASARSRCRSSARPTSS